MEKLFSIGEVSKIKGITVKALRYYHKEGILVPKHIDEMTGYRYYSIDQFVHIDIIKACRELGTSIKELQQIFKECDTLKLVEFLKIKRHEAEQNIYKMKEIIKNIDALDDGIKYSEDILNNNDIDIKFFEKRYIIISPCKEVGSLKELLYYSDLEKIIKEVDMQMSMERGIIYDIISNGTIEPRYVFNGIRSREIIEFQDNIKVLPEGNYLTMTYSKEYEDECIEKVLNYAEEHNLIVTNFLDLELFNDIFNTESYSCQIQVFIENQ